VSGLHLAARLAGRAMHRGCVVRVRAASGAHSGECPNALRDRTGARWAAPRRRLRVYRAPVQRRRPQPAASPIRSSWRAAFCRRWRLVNGRGLVSLWGRRRTWCRRGRGWFGNCVRSPRGRWYRAVPRV